jgi:predicted  nucleic acid-binding Zn-ribbon protein
MEENTQQDGTSEEIKDPAAVLAALDRAKKDAKAFREEKEALEAKLAQYEQDNAKFSGRLLREKVNQELGKLSGINPDRILKFIKFESLTFDDELNVLGLEDQIKELKDSFPELFDPKLLVAGKADSANNSGVDAKLSASQLQAKLVLGR